MANERIVVNGVEYISFDHLVECLAKACLQSHYDGDMWTTEYENNATEFVEQLLKSFIPNMEAYDAFVRSYVHQKYPQVFGKGKES